MADINTRLRLSRRRFMVTSSRSLIGTTTFLGLGAMSACSESPSEDAAPVPVSEQPTAQAQTPRITRIKMGTIGATDLKAIEEWYGEWIGYSVVERGEVDPALAASWGTPNTAGSPYILMQPDSGTDVFIRAVATEDVPGYQPMTTHGWNSFEIIVDDVYALNDRLVDGPFEIIGEPHSLGDAFPTIHAMQVIGPSKEVLYLTCETNPEATLLPKPGAFVGRPFIMVLASSDITSIQGFYASKFGIATGPADDTPIGVIARAQSLPEDHQFKMGFSPFSAPGNFIEFDGYPDTTGPRPQAEGQLPPGNAMASFSVKDLDELDIDFISAPVRDGSMAYDGNRSATFIGPSGALTEIVEEAG